MPDDDNWMVTKLSAACVVFSIITAGFTMLAHPSGSYEVDISLVIFVIFLISGIASAISLGRLYYIAQMKIFNSLWGNFTARSKPK